jgi:hypothetical protein
MRGRDRQWLRQQQQVSSLQASRINTPWSQKQMLAQQLQLPSVWPAGALKVRRLMQGWMLVLHGQHADVGQVLQVQHQQITQLHSNVAQVQRQCARPLLPPVRQAAQPAAQQQQQQGLTAGNMVLKTSALLQCGLQVAACQVAQQQLQQSVRFGTMTL